MEEWEQQFIDMLDVDYSYQLAKRMEEFRTNPALGYRTAGSKAEFETGEMLLREMKELGLSDVHKDRAVSYTHLGPGADGHHCGGNQGIF